MTDVAQKFTIEEAESKMNYLTDRLIANLMDDPERDLVPALEKARGLLERHMSSINELLDRYSDSAPTIDGPYVAAVDLDMDWEAGFSGGF